MRPRQDDTQGRKRARREGDAEHAQTLSGPLDLDTCSAEELMRVDGIDEVMARNIVEFRAGGQLDGIEALCNVPGMTPLLINRLRELSGH